MKRILIIVGVIAAIIVAVFVFFVSSIFSPGLDTENLQGATISFPGHPETNLKVWHRRSDFGGGGEGYGAQSSEEVKRSADENFTVPKFLLLLFPSKKAVVAQDGNTTWYLIPMRTAAALEDRGNYHEYIAVFSQTGEQTMNYDDAFRIDPLGSSFLGATSQGGVVTLNFSKSALQYLNSAPGIQSAFLNPIKQVLLQIHGVEKVQYAIDGQIITNWDA